MRKMFCFVSIFFLASILNVTADVPLSTLNEVNPQQSDNKCWVSGRVVWQGHNLKNATVQLFKDQKLKEIYTKGFLRDPEGIYALEIDDPGIYYMVAFVDDNGNDKIDTGDGMGIFGVMDWSDSSQQPEPLKLTKGEKLSGVDVIITGVANAQGRIVPISSSGSASLTTGISGKLILPSDPNYKFANALVFVYTDPTWNNRVTQIQVSQNGEYAVSIPVGKYYVLAVIDENKSNLLDAGDKFGVWGMTRFGMSPKPIEVTEGNAKTNRNILIVGRMNKSGKPVALYKAVSEPENALLQKNVSISGKVVWPGHELKNSIIQAYDDLSMTSSIAKAKADKDGNFQMNIPEGEYYITAGIDSDGNGKYTKGDGIGVYGAEDATTQIPKKLIIDKDFKEEINIVVTAEFDDSGQLIPITYDKQKDENKTETKINADLPVTGIRGKILWSDHKLSDITLVFSKDSSFKEGFKVPIKLDDDGAYACSTDPGVHYLMAMVDTNSNEQTDAGDGIGFYGTGYLGEGHWGEAQSVTVLESRVTPYINIDITAIIGDDGKPSATPDGVRAYYGDPNDIFNPDQVTQEWWYWTRGIAFTFSKIDEAWKLADVYSFTPREVPSKDTSENKANGVIYYTLDENIWAVDGDGQNRKRVASGVSVTGTFDGDKLIFFDRYNGLGLFSAYDQKMTKLGWLQIVPQPALSNDGKLVALTRESKGNKEIIIVNIETGNEMMIPGENLDMSCPSWSPDGELLAYSVSVPSVPEQKNPNRDIYYYDLVAKRTERVTSSPQDDFDPAWSPTEARMMVFARSQFQQVGQIEGESSQLWLVNFDKNGKPSEKQLTKYGGKNPAWSPDGNKVIYENNAQLWTIKLDGTDETPILVNDKPIFGLDPFWTR